MLSDATQHRITVLQDRYPSSRSALIPSLMVTQDESGYLSADTIRDVSQLFGLHPNAVYEVASFYTMLFKKTVGRHCLQVCTNISCSLSGCDAIMSYLRQRLNLSPGETSSDGRYTLLEVECLGSCNTAPILQLNNKDYFENLSIEKLDRLLDELK